MPDDDSTHPGAGLGLPESGRGSLATWPRRLAALVADWAVCMVVATLVFGRGVVTGHDWRSWMILATYVVEKAVLTALLGGSFGQLLARIAVVRVDAEQPIGWVRAMVRALTHAFVLPAVVIGADRRGLDDLMLGTAVVNRV